MPDELTIRTVPDLVGRRGDPWADIADEPQSIEPLLEMAARDREAGLHDAPWPPQYPKQPDEPPRVAPSRAKKTDVDERWTELDALNRIAYRLERRRGRHLQGAGLPPRRPGHRRHPRDELEALAPPDACRSIAGRRQVHGPGHRRGPAG